MNDVALHVIPTPTGEWAIKKSRAMKCSAVYSNFDYTVSKAMEIAYTKKYHFVYVHDKTGKIVRKITFED